MNNFVMLSKLEAGDQVGVISPSSGLPGVFPWVQDLGLQRLKEVFGLLPKEYPTTRQMNSSPADRARDIMQAFADPQNKAVFASIGGDDQVLVLKHLDPEVFKNNPKPFFGYSDNTNLHNFLWRLGIPSYYGGGVMTQLAMQGSMHDLTVEFMKYALFDSGEFELKASNKFNDEGIDWADPNNLNLTRKMESNDGFFWDGTTYAEGVLWGGCIETMTSLMAVGKYLPDAADLDGAILFLESAEDIPDHWIVEYLLRGMGERGWLNAVKGVLVGRPKAWEFDKPKNPSEKAEYRKRQRETILKEIRKYNQEIPIVQNLDFGHTDPQVCLSSGQKAKINSLQKTIHLQY